jgi:uncharacterized coiled-coil protein SlyX
MTFPARVDTERERQQVLSDYSRLEQQLAARDLVITEQRTEIGRLRGDVTTLEERLAETQALLARIQREGAQRGVARTLAEHLRRARGQVTALTAELRALRGEMAATDPLSCRVPWCAHPAKAMGCCQGHYKRLKRHGDPLLILRQVAGRGLVRCRETGPGTWEVVEASEA